MVRTSTVVLICLFVGLLTISSDPGVTAFLFPDVKRALRAARCTICIQQAATPSNNLLKQLMKNRGGGESVSQYKIGVMDEAPFCLPNGTGYARDLMQAIGLAYRQIHGNKDDIPYEIIPVKAWQQLADKARHSHWQVAFGLISTNLLRTDDTWRDWYVSSPTVVTTVKMLVPTHAVASDEFQQKPMHIRHHRRHHNRHGTSLTNYVNSEIDLHAKHPKYKVVVTRDSDEERLLVRSPTYRELLHRVDSLDEGLLYAQLHSDAVVITDAAVADYIAEREESGFTSVCPPKRIRGANLLYYGFFGKDRMIIEILNDLIRRMSEDGTLSELNSRYYGHVVYC